MKQFIAGAVVGLGLGIAITAHAAVIAGDNGYALGWTVEKNGQEVCDAPFVWIATKEIECD
jgi:hypothetical protein